MLIKRFSALTQIIFMFVFILVLVELFSFSMQIYILFLNNSYFNNQNINYFKQHHRYT